MTKYCTRFMLTKNKLANKIIEVYKKGGIFIFINSIQNWLPFDKILENGIIKLKNNKYIKIIKIIPINYNLKSNLEKESILNSYKIFLKSCNFDMQIIIQSKKEELNQYLLNLEKNKKNEKENIKNIIDEYIKNIKKLNSNNKSDSKQFFILINETLENNMEDNCIEKLNDKYFKIKECLSRCGNKVYNISSIEEIKEILERYFYLKNE